MTLEKYKNRKEYPHLITYNVNPVFELLRTFTIKFIKLNIVCLKFVIFTLFY